MVKTPAQLAAVPATCMSHAPANTHRPALTMWG